MKENGDAEEINKEKEIYNGNDKNNKDEIKNNDEDINNIIDISASKKVQNGEHISKEGPKFTEFIFTSIKLNLLNKKMPYGFKFESEENFLKSLELSKNNQRKAKQKVFLPEPKNMYKADEKSYK